MVKHSAEIAANRFGLGARPGDLRDIGNNGPDWLISQLGGNASFAPRSGTALPTSQEAYRQFQTYRKTVQAQRTADGKDDRGPGSDRRAKPGNARAMMQEDIYRREVGARTRRAVETSQPFLERLVHFWSNHFTVSLTKPPLRYLAGTFEREAIRPHVTGRFSDMLLAVARHPAMLIYLDNIQSFGPNSLVGKRRKRGLNENLARELLELHTVGVNGGYDQSDVTNLAKIITGWTLAPEKRLPGQAGTFMFIAQVHEPGRHSVLGKIYGQAGEQQGIAVLNDLARHPMTARFVATKLARHFISDRPPASSVDAIANAFERSDGDLKEVYRALIADKDAWAAEQRKVKTPLELVVSTLRAFGAEDLENAKLVQSQTLLGQPPFRAGSPAGWSDLAADWVGPDALKNRLDWANLLSRRFPAGARPLQIAEQALGETLSVATRSTLARAESASQAITLFLMSPDFQRR